MSRSLYTDLWPLCEFRFDKLLSIKSNMKTEQKGRFELLKNLVIYSSNNIVLLYQS